MDVDVEGVRHLRFDDGAPVRAASAVARLGDGWLVAQDDATHAAWVRPAGVERLRVLPPVAGLDTFEADAGTKRLKPDLEAALHVPDGDARVVLLGSGSSTLRTRAAAVTHESVVVTDLAPLYDRVAQVLGVARASLNLEGACLVRRGTDRVRWFHRGVPAAGDPTRSVDVDAGALLSAVLGERDPDDVPVGASRTYRLGDVDGVGLAVTDAVVVGGHVLASVAAEDTRDPRDDGLVVGSGLVVLDGERVVGRAVLPLVGGRVVKVEGLALLEEGPGGTLLLATVDDDDPLAASLAVTLRVRW